MKKKPHKKQIQTESCGKTTKFWSRHNYNNCPSLYEVCLYQQRQCRAVRSCLRLLHSRSCCEPNAEGRQASAVLATPACMLVSPVVDTRTTIVNVPTFQRNCHNRSADHVVFMLKVSVDCTLSQRRKPRACTITINTTIRHSHSNYNPQ